MKRAAFATFVAALGAGVTAPTAGQIARPDAIAFTSVGVVPMDRDRIELNWSVIVRDGRIAAAGPARAVAVPEGAVRVDGSGKFLMPALAEMHAHIPPGDEVPDEAIERTLFMYAARGIGTVRGMLGHARHLGYRERARRGEIFSPLIYTSGPSLNGSSAPTPDAAVKLVAAQKEAGFDFLKIHPGLSRETFDAMAAAAGKHDIRFAGHVPAAVGLERALGAGYATIDHLDGYMEALAGDGAPPSQWFGVNLVARVDEGRIPELVAKTRAAGTWMVPTEILLENSVSAESGESLAKRPEMKYASAQQLAQWIDGKKKFDQIPETGRRRFVEVRRKLIKALHDGGVPLLLGSDAPQIWNIPGFSVHRELQALVAAGLTPYEALATGTINVARFFGAESQRGTIALGKRADLVLVEGNPLTRIENTGQIAGVLINGRWMTKDEIEKRLESGR
jgi:imidazolonepropionase-like amidohydrolase